MWGGLAGIGVHLIVSGLVLLVLFVAQTFMYLENGAIFFTAFGAAGAAGMAAAKALGARRGAIILAAYCLVGVLMMIAQAWVEEERVRNIGACCVTVRSTAEVALWQGAAVVGLALGLVLAPRASVWSVRVRASLEAAGAYALASLPIMAFFPFYDPRVTPFEMQQAPHDWHVALVILQSVIAALVLAYRSKGLSAVGAAAAMALTGFVTVAFEDVSTWLHVPLSGWTYWPQSLLLVPLAGAVIALVILVGARAVGGVRGR